jgi:hypothetical protein
LQIVQCGPRRGEDIAPVIAESVLLEIEIIAGGRHELPHARSLGRGDRLRVERAFNVGQQGQLGWHAPALQFLDDMEQVFARALGHALHVFGAGGIPLFPVLHQFVLQVGHGKATADAIPQVGRREQGHHLLARRLGGSDGPQGAGE